MPKLRSIDTISPFPQLSAYDVIQKTPVYSKHVSALVAVQSIGSLAERIQDSANSIPMTHFGNQPRSFEPIQIATVSNRCVPPIPVIQSLGTFSGCPQHLTRSIAKVHFQNLPNTSLNSNRLNRTISTCNPAVLAVQSFKEECFESGPPNSSTTMPMVHFQNLQKVCAIGQETTASCSSSTDQSHGTPMECSKHHSQNSTNLVPMVHIKNAQKSFETGKLTTVRLVSPGESSTIETVLQMDSPEEMHTLRKSPESTEQNSTIQNQLNAESEPESPSSRPVYTSRQWFHISLAWLLAVKGLLLFLTLLSLTFSGYPRLLGSSLGSTLITINGIVSLLAAVYFFEKIRKYFW